MIPAFFQYFVQYKYRNIHVTCSFLKSKNIYWLPVCQTYCTHTYVLAAKKSHCTGINRKHTTSDVTAMQTKKTEKACQKRNNIIMTLYWFRKHWQGMLISSTSIHYDFSSCVAIYFDILDRKGLPHFLNKEIESRK